MTLRELKKNPSNLPLENALQSEIRQRQEVFEHRSQAHSISADEKSVTIKAIEFLEKCAQKAEQTTEPNKKFPTVKSLFAKEVKKHDKQIETDKSHLERAFSFIQQIWGVKQEMVLFLTELTSNAASLEFIQKWGCESYFKFNEDLLIYDVKEKLHQEVLNLNLD